MSIVVLCQQRGVKDIKGRRVKAGSILKTFGYQEKGHMEVINSSIAVFYYCYGVIKVNIHSKF